MRAGRELDLSAVFLDRDGVINSKAPEGDYVTSWDRFTFLPGALEGLRILAEAGPALVVVTNQRGIARGRMTEADLAGIHERMRAEVEAAGGRLDDIRHCPHEGGCECRKPGTGMFRDAAAALGLDLSRSAVIGDRAGDMLAAQGIGALKILVSDVDAEVAPEVDHHAPDLLSAARWLTRH